MTVSKLVVFVFLIFIYMPRIKLFEIPGATSVFRLDVLLAIFLSLCFMLYLFVFLLTNFKVKNGLSGLFVIISIFISVVFINTSKDLLFSISLLLLYFGIITSFYMPALIARNFKFKAETVLVCFVNFNVIVHLFSIILPHLGFHTSPSYGLFGMPFSFCYVVGLVLVLHFSKFIELPKVWVLAYFVAIIVGDSRIVLASIVVVFILNLNIKSFSFLFSCSAAFLVFGAEIGDVKSLRIFTMNWSDFLQDPSLKMRLVNIENYLDWVTIKSFLFGGGVLSFLEYSIAYGEPGPLDLLYLRILSDFGIINILLLLLFISYSLWVKRYWVFSNKKVFISLMVFILLYSFFNEGVLAIKTGHITFFTLGLFFYKVRVGLSSVRVDS